MEWQPNENKVVVIILSFLCNQLKVAELPTSYAQLLITTAGPRKSNVVFQLLHPGVARSTMWIHMLSGDPACLRRETATRRVSWAAWISAGNRRPWCRTIIPSILGNPVRQYCLLSKWNTRPTQYFMAVKYGSLGHSLMSLKYLVDGLSALLANTISLWVVPLYRLFTNGKQYLQVAVAIIGKLLSDIVVSASYFGLTLTSSGNGCFRFPSVVFK